MTAFRPEIPPNVAEVIRHLPPDIKRGIKSALCLLSEDPEAGEPLIRELEGLWKYRVKRFRIVYAVDRKLRLLRIMAVVHRRRVYEALVEEIRGRK